MGQRFSEISAKHSEFITAQKIFFVGTATEDSRVNISPKGMDALRILDSTTVIWLNVTGSGNETAAHVQTHPRMTIMFASFAGAPLILRLYGTTEAVHHNDPEWQSLYSHFPPTPGARQIFRLKVDLVQNSCGMAVPFYDYAGEREQLKNWASGKGDEGLKDYWQEKNQVSLDGIPTHILDKNT